jgi:5,10-methylene-tetrahydrofolate dehydrogenase/methenyl tetrahydrofolate cyclohydrolase
MPATLIDGKAIAEDVRAAVKARVAALVSAGRRAPCLAVVLVGARPDSATYVRNKKAACAGAGITDRGVDLPETATEAEVLAVVEALNADPTVDGILVQLPLPKHVDETTVLRRISLEKDADGLHPLNVGALALKGHAPRAVACTPKGCLELLRRAGVPIAGRRAVVLGRSNIVGIPMALLLLENNATVTVCHSRTEDLPGVLREVRASRQSAAPPPAPRRPRPARSPNHTHTHTRTCARAYPFFERRRTLWLPP